ncbi:MAG TPA: GNAT family N-acetyltransferase [Acetobacteraceae bacterium]
MRPADPAHAAALAAIHAAAFPPATAWDAQAFAGQLASPWVFGLIDAAGALILARVAADEAEILTLAVVPSARRRGLATALVGRAMRQAATRGASAMFLEVAETNVAALSLYAGMGFRPAGRRPRYYPDGVDALVLKAPINSCRGLACPLSIRPEDYSRTHAIVDRGGAEKSVRSLPHTT